MKRFLFPAILIATVLTGGVLAYAIWKAVPVSPQQYFESGKKYYEEKKYSEAAIQFLNVVQRDPKNRDAHYLLAKTFNMQNNLDATVKSLKALLELFPDDVEAQLDLGNLYLSIGRADPQFYREAADLAQKVLAKQPNNIPALILAGNAASGLKNYEASLELFEKAISLDPKSPAAYVSLGTSHVLQKNYAAAEKAYLKAREVDPKAKHGMLSLGNYYRLIGDTAKADAVFKELLSIYPAEQDVYVQVVDFYYKEGRFDDVEQILRNAQAGSADDPQPSFLLADFYTARNRPADARKLLLDLKNRFPGNVQVAEKVALAFLREDPARAEAEADGILKADPKHVFAQILRGELRFFAGQYDAAAAILASEPVLNSTYPQPHFFLGEIAKQNKKTDEAQDHYQKSLVLDPGYAIARTGLAEMFLLKGRRADAREEIRRALVAQPWLDRARILKVAVDTLDKNYAEAERELALLVKEQPNNPALQVQQAVLYEAKGQKSEAENSLRRALELVPGSADILRQLTDFYIREKQTDRALQAINTIPDDKKQAFHYELIGTVYSRAGKTEEAEKAYRTALEKDPAASRPHAYLAGQYSQSGRFDEALKQLDELIRKEPANPTGYTMKAGIFQIQGKTEDAKRNLREALRIDPDNVAAADSLAYLMAEEGTDLQGALGLAQNARRRQPDNAGSADTLGWIYHKLGNQVLAKDQLEFAVSRNPANPVFQYHLAVIYNETKQFSQAQAALKRALGGSGDFKEKPLAEALLNEIGKRR
jgi:tetratricopeptide (TPR) repeat protein